MGLQMLLMHNTRQTKKKKQIIVINMKENGFKILNLKPANRNPNNISVVKGTKY